MIVFYILLVYFSFTVIKEAYLEEKHKERLGWLETTIIFMLSLATFFSIFLILAYFTIRSNNHHRGKAKR